MSQSKVQHIFRVFDALNLVKGIKAVGGPDHQTYYIESDVYAPDRRITPLILQPYVEVSDPNGVIPAGDKVGELSSASWYIGEAILANKITAKESEATLDTPFAIGENNALHVRKNSTKSILLIFEGEYLDIRKDKNIHISLTYTLTTTSNTEVKPAPKLMLSKPQSWKYCPLEDQTKAVIEATVSQDSKLYRSAVQWVKVEGDKETLIGENDPFYIEGQNTDKLTINPSLMGSTLIRAKNHDEVFYNEIYGINPEWDHRMNEVMQNRNLFSYNRVKVFQGGYSANAISPIFYTTRISTSEGIKLKQNTTYYISISEDYEIWFPIFIDSKVVKNPSPNFKSYEKIEVGEKEEEVYISIRKKGASYDSTDPIDEIRIVDIKTCQLKLEESSNPTPYTPAPEDLNNKNLFKGLDYREDIKHKDVFFNSYVKLTYNNLDKCTDVELLGRSPSRFELNIPANTIRANKVYSVSILLNRPLKSTTKDNVNCTATDMSIAPCRNGYLHHYLLKIENDTSEATARHYFEDFQKGDVYKLYYAKIEEGGIPTNWSNNPNDLASDGILKGTYQSDIKFTRYFPKLETEIDFLTGDTLRAGMDTVKMKAVFKTNKEEIKNPEQYFDIKWYLDPVEAGGKAEYLGQGEYLEVPISKIPLKARAIPFRLEYEFK